jgi:AcrR family transcriptional regulator
MKADLTSPVAASTKRPYRQGLRAEAMAATADRMASAFFARLREQWFDEIRLEDVARDAEVSVQTLIRHFGGKEGLVEAAVRLFGDEVRARRNVASGDVDAVLRALIDDYEVGGDLVIRILAQEDRHPAVRRATDVGRAGHRQWLTDAFAPALAGLGPGERQRRLDALVAATDVYVWKLVRRDMGRSRDQLHTLMRDFVEAALRDLPAGPGPKS